MPCSLDEEQTSSFSFWRTARNARCRPAKNAIPPSRRLYYTPGCLIQGRFCTVFYSAGDVANTARSHTVLDDFSYQTSSNFKRLCWLVNRYGRELCAGPFKVTHDRNCEFRVEYAILRSVRSSSGATAKGYG